MSEKKSTMAHPLGESGRQDYVRKFLFGGSGIYRDSQSVQATLHMGLHTEGWIGIPHGGIGMGAVLELAAMLEKDPQNEASLYPLSVAFRMGGARLRIGDQVKVTVSSGDGGAKGVISVDPDAPHYLSASLAYGTAAPGQVDIVSSCLPGGFSTLNEGLLDLPYYKNCFVCGVERRHPGLKRQFFLVGNGLPGKVVIARIGFDKDDQDNVFLFRRDRFIHPVVFLALLDEAIGWGGFMLTGSGGVTVRIDYTFHRPIEVGEKIIVFGRGERMRGSAGARLLFWASGAAAVLKDDGCLETVITAAGQYMGMSELTEQMQSELIPRELTERAFALAGS